MYQSENFEIKFLKFARRTIIKLLLNQLEVSALPERWKTRLVKFNTLFRSTVYASLDGLFQKRKIFFQSPNFTLFSLVHDKHGEKLTRDSALNSCSSKATKVASI